MPRQPLLRIVPSPGRKGTFSLKKGRGRTAWATLGTVARFRKYPGRIRLGFIGDDATGWQPIRIRRKK